MKLEVKKLDSLKRKLDITIPEDVVTERINNAYKPPYFRMINVFGSDFSINNLISLFVLVTATLYHWLLLIVIVASIDVQLLPLFSLYPNFSIPPPISNKPLYHNKL